MPSFEQIYRETESNVNKAVTQFKKLKEENEKLRLENLNLRNQLQIVQKRLDETEEKLKLIELTKTTLSTEDSKELKKQINEWVREIENSIRILEKGSDG